MARITPLEVYCHTSFTYKPNALTFTWSRKCTDSFQGRNLIN